MHGEHRILLLRMVMMMMTALLSRPFVSSLSARSTSLKMMAFTRTHRPTTSAFIIQRTQQSATSSVRRFQGIAAPLSYVNDKVKDNTMFSSSAASSEKTSLLPAISRKPLPSSDLRWKCDPDQFKFQNTNELDDIQHTNTSLLLNQKRAASSLEFGVNMNQEGYNLFVLGPSGSGKRTLVRNYLEQHSLSGPPASDWAYVQNFKDHDHPKALQLPAGLGVCLRDDLKQLIEDIQSAIPAALESDQHRSDVQQVKDDIFQEQQKSLEELGEEAGKHDLAIIRTPAGFVLGGPKDEEEDDGKIISPEKKAELKASIELLSPQLNEILNKFPKMQKKVDQKVKELNEQVAKDAIEVLMEPLKTRYKDLPGVVAHLEAIEAEVVERADDIRQSQENEDEPENLMALVMKPRRKQVSFNQYNINLIVDNSEVLSEGAPVVYEDFPKYYNLIGRTEHLNQFGTFLTDFSLIKAGALHRANGGYLVLNARDVLMQPFTWEALKRCLRSGTIKIESLGAEYGLISTISLEPEPIELNTKVVLLGDRMLYYLLCQYDPEFNDLFKVAADFDDEMDRTPEACDLFAHMLATLAKEKDLKPMDKQAVSAMIEQAARQVGDQEKLSTHMTSIVDLLCESDYYAGVDDAKVIGAQHVGKAIDHQIYRSDRIRDLIYEQIRRGTLMVDVKGSKVGQVNGLSVMALGSLMFGRPSRITATARLGRGKVLDIEREVELGGPTHSKGVMILSSLLSSRYALDCPLCMSANLVFEQSYGHIEGDSASMAELCALLSTLAEVPISQGMAITGSVNQFGESQAIGGVTEKIEGFYDVCSACGSGLTGEQGVLIPEANVPHLMLRSDVLDAVEQGKFAVYTYKTIDEAIELLTGDKAGVRVGVDGEYEVDTINYKVDARLHEFADMVRKFSDGGEDSSADEGEEE